MCVRERQFEERTSVLESAFGVALCAQVLPLRDDDDDDDASVNVCGGEEEEKQEEEEECVLSQLGTFNKSLDDSSLIDSRLEPLQPLVCRLQLKKYG